MRVLKVFVVFLQASCLNWAVAQYTYNYCDPNLCYGLQHIACGNDAGYGPQCSHDSELLDLTSFRGLIADRHNSYRDDIAGGHVPGFRPAIRMATMQYDEELEYLASLNALRCTFDHDECRNTDRFPQSGQNLAYRWDPVGHVPTAMEAMVWAIDYWISEYADADMSQVDSYYEGRGTEHFLVMVAEKNTGVGCGGLQQPEGNGMATMIVCNYATTNIIDRPIYRQGLTPASRCVSGTNYDFPNLCDETERYSANSDIW